MKGQLGTQVKDASHSALGNRRLEQQAERERGSGVREVRRGGVAPASNTSRGWGGGGRQQGERSEGPAGSITWALPAKAARRLARTGCGGRRVTYLPTVWLASWRMRLNCFFIVAPLPR